MVFVGTFTAGALAVRCEAGRLHIDHEGGARKFVREVEHRTFSGAEALRRGQRVLYVTERCVFQLVAAWGEAGEAPRTGGADGAAPLRGELELIELAPGIDLQRDVLAHMAFVPRISPDLRPMEARLFLDEPLGLREQLLNRPLAQRYELDHARRVLHIDFSGLQVNAPDVISAIDATARALLVPLGERVDVVVNYDHFGIAPELLDEYSAMVRRLAAEFYGRVTRYGTTGFLKSRLSGLREA